MRRQRIAVVGFAVLGMMAGWAASAAAAAQNGVATVIVRTGMVDVKRNGQEQWQKAEKGMLLFEGDRVKTRELSRAAIMLEDGSVIRLNENTDFSLAVKSADQKKNRVKLLLGRLWAKITKQDSDLEIETPSAVAAIKGTELELWVAADGSSTLTVWDGLVRFFSERGQAQVRAGQRSRGRRDQGPTAVESVDLNTLDQWFNSVVETPASRSLQVVVKDKAGREHAVKINYRKK